MDTTETAGKVIVGVDGSEHSRRALAWALAEARLRGVGCVLVHAWDFGLAASSPVPGDALHVLVDDANTLLDRDLAFARSFGVPVKGILVYGSAGHALIETSADALVLVVGSRGRGGLVSALLGSVSSACVHHATCPVVVVPPDRRTGGDIAGDAQRAVSEPAAT
jgi:nucleotide-binding universal stress UspA family protein